jgi:hypothetical protein
MHLYRTRCSVQIISERTILSFPSTLTQPAQCIVNPYFHNQTLDIMDQSLRGTGATARQYRVRGADTVARFAQCTWIFHAYAFFQCDEKTAKRAYISITGSTASFFAFCTLRLPAGLLRYISPAAFAYRKNNWPILDVCQRLSDSRHPETSRSRSHAFNAS